MAIQVERTTFIVVYTDADGVVGDQYGGVFYHVRGHNLVAGWAYVFAAEEGGTWTFYHTGDVSEFVDPTWAGAVQLTWYYDSETGMTDTPYSYSQGLFSSGSGSHPFTTYDYVWLGDDILSLFGQSYYEADATEPVILSGTDGSDLIEGSAAGDLVYAYSGPDYLYGLGGADTLVAGDGEDLLVGDTGNDVMYGEAGGDILVGDAGNDTLDGGTHVDLLYGGDGDDCLMAGPGEESNNYLNGGIGSDTMNGDLASDLMEGGAGDYGLYGLAGHDTLWGGAGHDLITGGSGIDFLVGEAGNDRLYGGDDNDALYGDVDDDELYGDTGVDVLYGGNGNDRLDGGTGGDYLDGGMGDDALYFDQGNDLLYGNGGNDIFNLVMPSGGFTTEDGYFFGYDTITTFQGGAGLSDQLRFVGTYFDTDAEVRANAVYDGFNTTITNITATFDTIVLVGVDIATLHADDFLFA
jgi:Ca2+-binding RTX toxin-like protein